MRGSPGLLIAFLGKTVQKALPPSLFAELSQLQTMHVDIQVLSCYPQLASAPI